MHCAIGMTFGLAECVVIVFYVTRCNYSHQKKNKIEYKVCLPNLLPIFVNLDSNLPLIFAPYAKMIQQTNLMFVHDMLAIIYPLLPWQFPPAYYEFTNKQYYHYIFFSKKSKLRHHLTKKKIIN